MNPLQQLASLGHSVWYDYIRRDLARNGELQRWIHEDDLRGMTSNPTIFQKAIAGSDLYDEEILRLARTGLEAHALFERLAIADVQACADLFRPVWERSKGTDGFVSLEVRPDLARDAEATLREARRLHEACARPNVMIKIPGTREGLPAIRDALAAGISVNVTLLFSVERYREVMEAYLAGMERLLASGKSPERVRSVASFFVSRVDSKIDKTLDGLSKGGAEGTAALRGRAAIANARAAYRAFEEVFALPRARNLARQGVRAQRPLWASTSTKDPAYPALYYVEALIAPESVDTMPPETYEAYRASGRPAVRVREQADELERLAPALARLGIDLARVCSELEQEGITKFAESYDALIAAVGEKARSMGVG